MMHLPIVVRLILLVGIVVSMLIAGDYYLVVPVNHSFSVFEDGMSGAPASVSFPVGSSVELNWEIGNQSGSAQFVLLCGWSDWVYNATGTSGETSFVVPNSGISPGLCGFWATGIASHSVLHVWGTFAAPRYGPGLIRN